MKRFLIITLAVWIFILGPGLCLGGALAHACDDCAEESFCEHEDECSADPCADPALQSQIVSTPSFVMYPVGNYDRFASPRVAEPRPVWRSVNRPPTDNLPRPESDLPLLR